jgi:predicted MFS family arabinose efflux permease
MKLPRTQAAALIVAHVVGMIDLVALPLWIGALMNRFGWNPAEAGFQVTAYLTCAVLASAWLAPRSPRIRGRRAATLSYLVAAAAFGGLAVAPSFALVAALHVLAGAGVGCGLSLAHGAIARTANPHRLFACAHLGLGLFGIAFFALTPLAIEQFGPAALFQIFCGLCLLAAVVNAVAFPVADDRATPAHAAPDARQPLDKRCGWIIGGIVLMALNQALVFSFVERIGVARGFAQSHVNAVLVACGFVNLLPPLAAALLQRRLRATTVAVAGPVAQIVLALVISQSADFAPYALATACWVFAMIFTHTFLFGLLARLDPTGRANASTPAMLMSGSAIGPLLGGLLIVRFGFGALGVAATVIGLACVMLMRRVRDSDASLDATGAGAAQSPGQA